MGSPYVLESAPPEVTLALADRFLDAPELERMARYHRDETRLEFLIGRWFLKRVLREYHGVHEPRLTCVMHEKPRLMGAGPRFSLSHAGGGFAVAVSDVEVGIDLEPVRPLTADLLVIALSDEERGYVGSDLDFFRVWTAKEAYMKRSGEGLGIEPRRLTVDLAHDLLRDSADGSSHRFAWQERGRFVLSWM
jgi:4'-phosphopantetheinyl transferase